MLTDNLLENADPEVFLRVGPFRELNMMIKDPTYSFVCCPRPRHDPLFFSKNFFPSRFLNQKNGQKRDVSAGCHPNGGGGRGYGPAG